VQAICTGMAHPVARPYEEHTRFFFATLIGAGLTCSTYVHADDPVLLGKRLPHNWSMRYAGLLAVLVLCLAVASANPQEPLAGSPSCPISTVAAPSRYDRLHQIPTVAARDDISHRMVTPGGMMLDLPKMVAATDVLTIVARDEGAMCFGLLTFSRDRHRCELTGVARSVSDDTFLFREGDVAVRFTFLGDDQVRVEPIGTEYRNQCESLGKIEPAIYTLSSKED
jgi:hypothetical protein